MTVAVTRIPFSEFERRLLPKAKSAHVPVSGMFELTYRCNFECVHCYEQDVRDQVELSTERWCALVDQVADLGCLWLTLTGGEALLHPGFEQIYERAIRRGLLVTVFSNGSLLTERVADLFRRLPPRSVEVTLYGFSAETYEKSTGRPRGFEQAKAGLERMVALGLDVQVKTMAFAETAGDFEAIRDYAKELGTSFRYDTTVHATLAGGTAPLAHRLTPKQIIALEALEPPAAAAAQEPATPHPQGSDEVYRCSAGRLAFTIAPDGALQLCTLVRSLRFDLARTDFTEAWGSLGREVERRYTSRDRRCNGCALRYMCGTCPGIAELESGSVESSIDHICETTHRRASEAAGYEIIPAWKLGRPREFKLTVLSESGAGHGRAAQKQSGCAGCPSTLRQAGH
jgi:radical SAM protein with 4Fe4S-binding SPASM domain